MKNPYFQMKTCFDGPPSDVLHDIARFLGIEIVLWSTHGYSSLFKARVRRCWPAGSNAWDALWYIADAWGVSVRLVGERE